jgi:hypothetical protein
MWEWMKEKHNREKNSIRPNKKLKNDWWNGNHNPDRIKIKYYLIFNTPKRSKSKKIL